jgi:hypothetical protein
MNASLRTSQPPFHRSILRLVIITLLGSLLPITALTPVVQAATLDFSDTVDVGGLEEFWADYGVGDLNNDGRLDFVIGRDSFRGSQVWLNTGSDSFGNPTFGVAALGFKTVGNTNDSSSAKSVALGDLDNDGDLDLVIGRLGLYGERTTDYQSYLFLNDGTGVFTQSRAFGPATARIGAVALGDMDNDGDLDIVTGQVERQSAIYLNDGNANFPTSILLGDGTQVFNDGEVGDLDKDGDLDIVLVQGFLNSQLPTELRQSYIYYNNFIGGGSGFTQANLGAPAQAFSVALGDVDGDSYLDIGVGKQGPTLIYANGGTSAYTSTFAVGSGDTTSADTLAMADINGDGFVDVLRGSAFGQNAAFLNNGSAGFTAAADYVPVGPNSTRTRSVALADIDQDNDLDVLTANSDQQSVIFRNNGAGRFGLGTNLPGADPQQMRTVALGDMNGDGHLDVVAGHRLQTSRILLNDGSGNFAAGSTFGSATDQTRAIALGDLDGDTDLDVVQIRYGQTDLIYLNTGNGTLAAGTPFGQTDSRTSTVVLGDTDRDGDLDIAVAAGGGLYGESTQNTSDRLQHAVYMNDGAGGFASNSECSLASAITAVRCFTVFGTVNDLDLVDVNADGYLDLLVGNFFGGDYYILNDTQGNFTFGNSNRIHQQANLATRMITAADMDNDGDMDFVVAVQRTGLSKVYFTNPQPGQPANAVFGDGSQDITSAAVGDMDGDGDLDIVTTNFGSDIGTTKQSQVYLNDGRGGFATNRLLGTGNDPTTGVAIGDLDADGMLDVVSVGVRFPFSGSPQTHPGTVYLNPLARSKGVANNLPSVQVRRPVTTKEAGAGSTPIVLTERNISISYRLADPEGDPIAQVRAFYSLDGGGNWSPAVAAAGTPTNDLAAAKTGTTHTFTWDTFASGVFGQSDQVLFRIDALPSRRPQVAKAAGQFQRGFVLGQSQPFRVRGTQVVVRNAAGEPQPGALVYRIPNGQIRDGQPFKTSDGTLLKTGPTGLLPGRSQIGIGDALVALLPITVVDEYTRYHTSAAVGVNGLEGFAITQPGVQTLTVRPTNPLLAINLTVSLEWDARNDPAYMNQLNADLSRTSELLYTWTDGQIALGAVKIYHDKTEWETADVQIYATNGLRPNANQGGITRFDQPDPTAPGVVYETGGQIRMGAVWNSHGDITGSIGEDWPAAFGHEIGHWALFLDEDYLGLNDQKQVISVETCPSPMSDPYRDDYAQFRPDAGWLPGCANTLNQRVSGRSNWGTIKTFWDSAAENFTLNSPASFAPAEGPQVLPLGITTISEVLPSQPATSLTKQLFSLQKPDGTRYLVGSGAKVILFSADGQRLTDMGSPNQNEALARGARVGDRICVFDLPKENLGCEPIRNGDLEITMSPAPGWAPELLITPATSSTFSLVVTNVPAGLTLKARLYAAEGAPSSEVTLNGDGSQYTAQIATNTPILAGSLHVFVDEAAPRREVVTDYALGGNPAPPSKPKKTKGKKAPALSPDGAVVLYGDALNFNPGAFYAIQRLTSLPTDPPTWTSAVGDGYRLLASANAPDLSSASLNMGYLEEDVIPGTEGGIGIYYLPVGGQTWQRLVSRLDTQYNEVSAAARGPGFYVLMSSLNLRTGWNILNYPWAAPTPVREAMAELNAEEAFTTVYGYEPANSTDPWKVFDIDVPDWVNDLSELRYGVGYWVNILVGSNGQAAAQTQAANLPTPPATYYVTLDPALGVAADSPVEARIGTVVCGSTTTRTVNGQVVFAIDVLAELEGRIGCGAPGRSVSFHAGETALPYQANWANGRPTNLLAADAEQRLYLPIVIQQ